MAAITPDLTTGATITFSSSFLARILNIDWSGISRDALETTTTATTGGRTFIPSDTYDPGQLTVEIQFDTDASPPITSTAETVTVTWPDLETWSAAGFLQDFSISAANEQVMTATAVVKFTGSITF